MKMCKVLLVVLVAAFGSAAWASTYTVTPVLAGAVMENGTGLYTGAGLVGYWGVDVGLRYFNSWAKFDIPVYPGEVITQVMLTTDVLGQYNGPDYPAGVLLHRATDDSWTASTISYNAPVVGDSEIVHRSIFDPPALALGLRSTDITSYVQAAGEGQGNLLTVRLGNWYSGMRGCYYLEPWLTITTEVIPEPMTLALLGLGGLMTALRRKR